MKKGVSVLFILFLFLSISASTSKVNAKTSEYSAKTLGENYQGFYMNSGERGYLNITSTPLGAKVYIDGSYTGETPLPEYPLTPGYHVVGITYPGLPSYATLVEVQNGTSSSLNVNLTALPAGDGLRWEWSSGAPIKTAATTPGGNLTVVGTENHVVAINHDGIPLWHYELPDTVSYVSVSDDGSIIAVGTLYGNTVYVLNGNGNLLWEKAVTGNVQALDVSGDGNYIAVGTSGSLLHLFRRDGTQLWVYPPNSGTQSNKNVITVAISPNDDYVAAGRLDGTLWLIKIDGTPVFSRYLGGAVNKVTISEDGKYLLAGSNDNNLYVYTTSGTLKWSKRFSDDVYRVSTAEGKIAVGTWDGKVVLLDFNGNLLWENSMGSSVTALDMSSNGSYVVVGTVFGKVSVFRTTDGATIWSHSTNSRIWKTEIVPTTGEVTVASNDLRYFNALSFVECKLEAENVINSAEEVINNAREHGINVTEALNLLNQAKEKLSAGDCNAAKDLAEQAKVEANNTIEEAKAKAESAIESAKNEIATAEDRGIDVANATSLLNEANNLFMNGYYPAAEEKATGAYQLAHVLILKADAEDAISQAEGKVNYTLPRGINVTAAISLLNRAKEEYANGEYENAKEDANSAIQEVENAIEKAKQDALSKINNAKNEIKSAENLGLNVPEAKDILNTALSLFNQEYYPEAGEKAEEAYQKALEAILKNEALQAINLAEGAVQNATAQGVNVGDAQELLNRAMNELNSGNYTGAKELAVQAHTNVVISVARSLIQWATEKGYNVSKEIVLLSRATGEYNSGDYERAAADAQEITKSIQEKINRTKQGAWDKIDLANRTMERVIQELELAKSQGANRTLLSKWENTLQGAKNTLNSAIRAYQEEDYIQAQNLASSSYESLNSILSDMGQTLVNIQKIMAEEYIQTAKEALQNATSTLDILKTVDVDTQSLQAAITSANSTLKESISAFDSEDYDTAISKAEESTRTVNDAITEINRRAQKKASSEISTAENCISSATNDGVKVENAKNHLNLAKSAFSNGDYITAIKEALSAKSACNQTMQLFQTASTRINLVNGTLRSLASKGIGYPDAESLLERARKKLESGDYATAGDLANKALNSAQSCEKRGTELLQDIESVNETLVSLQNGGYYTGNVGTLLEKALEAVKRGNFDEAGNYVSQANSTLIKLKEEGDRALEKINEAERAIKDAEGQGLNPDSAKKLLQEAKEAMAKGDYEGAIALASEAREKANDVDGDGIPNSQDPFPTVNNYIIYGLVGALLLTFAFLLVKYLKRRKLNRIYREITAAFKELKNSVIPSEASQNMEKLKGLIREANNAHREGDMKKLERILKDAKSLQGEIESKRKEYESLKKEIIEEINSLLGRPVEKEGEESAS